MGVFLHRDRAAFVYRHLLLLLINESISPGNIELQIIINQLHKNIFKSSSDTFSSHILKMSSSGLPLRWQNSTEQQPRIPSERNSIISSITEKNEFQIFLSS